jgi:radical SAM superfamily enzyme YgiQ (UPF0313 family)
MDSKANFQNMETLSRIKKQATRPLKIDKNRPHFGIVVPPSPFTVPAGWEFVLRQPFEGVSYIATVLYNAGYPVKVIDVRFEADPVTEALKQAVNSVDVLGIATFEDSFAFLEKFTLRIKSQKPELPVVLGGSLVTSVPSTVMNNTPADIAVLGEGELTILELMDLIDNDRLELFDKISGLCYKDNRRNLVFTPPRPQMKDLNSLPTMNLSLWPGAKENSHIKEILFSHSRGCYMNCSFCYRTTPKLSLKSVDKFREELRELKKRHNFEFIYFVDLTFAIEKKRTLQICQVLKELDVKWSCMSRVQNLDRQILKEMKDAGCQVILYGFESLDHRVLNKAHKGQSPDEIRMIFDLTQEAEIQVGGLFILGLPGETRESINKVIDFIRDVNGACRVKYLSAIPGTEIYRLGLENGVIKDELKHLRWLSKETGQSNDEFLNFTQLTDEELRQAYKTISSMYIKGPRYEAWS